MTDGYSMLILVSFLNSDDDRMMFAQLSTLDACLLHSCTREIHSKVKYHMFTIMFIVLALSQVNMRIAMF